jgi:flagellin
MAQGSATGRFLAQGGQEMSMRINHNIAAMNTWRNLDKADRALSLSLERLSSGLRINKAADDPASLSISEKMRAQITGLTQALENNETAISIIQTAEGALTEVHNLLNEMRELALHAANEGVNDETMLQADQDQIESIIQTINRIAETTQFGTLTLLDGSKENMVSITQNLSDIEQISESSLSEGQHTISVSGVIQQNQYINNPNLGLMNPTSVSGLSAGDHNITVTQASAAAVYSGLEIDFDTQPVTITSGENDMFLLNLDGETPLTVTVAAGAYTNITTLSAAVENAVNAALTAVSESTEEIVVSNDGDALTFTLADEGSANYLQVSTHPTSSALNDIGLLAGTALGQNAVVTLDNNVNYITNIDNVDPGTATIMDSDGNTVVFDVGNTSEGIDIGTTVLTVNPTSFLVRLDNANQKLFYANQVDTISNGSESVKLVFGDDVAIGNSILRVKDNALYFQVGANQDQTVRIGIRSTAASQLGTMSLRLSEIDVTDPEDAQRAIETIDISIDQVSRQRSVLGSFQKYILISNLDSLMIANENMTAAESVIRDANMAFEIAEYTRNQIVVQAGTAMLAHANMLPQSVLQLLNG